MSLIFSKDDVLYMTDEDGDIVEVPTRREFVEVAIAALRAKYDELTQELLNDPKPDTALNRKNIYANIMQLGTLLNPARGQ